MKQMLAIAVLIVYFCTTTGFVISMHYCLKQMDRSEAGANNSQRGKCAMEKKDGCCRDHVKVVKLQTLHLTPKLIAAEFRAPGIAFISTEFILSPLKNSFSEAVFIADSPPADEQDTWLQNRVLRI